MKLSLSGSIAALVSLAVVGPALAQAPAKVTYDDHVMPIFRNACLNCHNPDKKKAGLDLSTYSATLQGSETGKVVQSGNPGASLLFKVCKQTEEPKMPPKGDKLTDAELAVLEKWIAGQLLENATGKAVAAAQNNVQAAVVSLERPAGPPPMPGDLPLEPFVRPRGRNAVVALAASPWAPLVAVGGQKQITLYNTESLEPLGVLPFPEGFPAIVRFSRNGQLLLTGGGLGGKSGKVALWDIKTGERVATIGNEFDQVLGADISPDHQFVALGGPNKIVKIYSTKDGRLATSMKKHTDWVTAVAYSPDGKFLATADRNGGVVVWEGSTGKEYNTLPGHKVMVTALAFMTGVVASASEDGKIALWDVKEGKEIRSWNAHGGGAAWVDFTPDGRLVSCGRDKIAKVWDQTGKTLGATQPFGDIALRAALNSDRVIAGDWTGQIRVTALDGKPLGELSANPVPIAERLDDAQKRVSELQAALPGLEQAFAAADAKVKAEKAAAEEKRKADEAALEAVKALPGQIEKRIADEKTQLEELRKAREAAPAEQKAAANAKIDEQQAKLAASDKELRDAKKTLDARLAEAAKAKAPATPPLPANVAELKKKFDNLTAEIARRREARAKHKEGTPEFAAADAKVQEIKQQVLDAEAKFAAAQKAVPPAAPKLSPSEEEFAKARSALDETTAKLAAAKTELGKWQRAQAFMSVHKARQTFADKKAQHEGLLAAAKDAVAAAENARAALAAAEQAAEKAPAQVKEKEALLVQARAPLDAANKAIADAEAAIAEKEKAIAALTEAAKAAKPNIDELTKKLEQLNAEITKRREFRATKQQGTPEYADADSKVQAMKPDIAAAEAALQAAKTGGKPAESPELKAAQGELARLRESLEKVRLDAKTEGVKVAAAEKVVADARTAADEAAQTFKKLRKETPEAIRAANAAKRKAEQEAATAARELESAKAKAERARAEFESKWQPPKKAA